MTCITADTDQQTTTFAEKHEPTSTLICTMYEDNATRAHELHEYTRDHRFSAYFKHCVDTQENPYSIVKSNFDYFILFQTPVK